MPLFCAEVYNVLPCLSKIPELSYEGWFACEIKLKNDRIIAVCTIKSGENSVVPVYSCTQIKQENILPQITRKWLDGRFNVG